MFRFMPASMLRAFLYLFFRTIYRLEVRGLENVKKGGANPIFAGNHVSYLDGPLVMSLIDDAPVFAIDYQMASYWWVRPLLRLTRAMPVNPANPLATRTLINAVKAGNPLIIFPEGRRTVTGSLMKVYDGAAMVADKSDASVIPVRIDGVEHGPFTHLQGHEQIAVCQDSRSGLRALIAIHSTARGPALGGTRFHAYPSEAEALRDVLNLARGMSYKAAMAGLDLGGGKAVIIGDPVTQKSPELLRAYGRFVQSLNGRLSVRCD